MRFHYIFCLCVAGCSGGNFFTPTETGLPPVVAGKFTVATGGHATHHFSEPRSAGSRFPVPPLPQAYAHNDYEHDRPLFDALAQGFAYIEADVHLMDGELYVAHVTPLFISKEKTLNELYLKPLREMAQQNGGWIFPGSDRPLYLMIDIKTGAAETFEALKTYLEPYREMLTTFENGVKTERAVHIFLSGNRPVRQLAAEPNRLMSLDGRIEDLGEGYPPDLMPVVSERFSHIFGWEIFGRQRTENQWLVLSHLARLTHAEGKKLRLWASPEEEIVWQKMLDSGCDLINTDELERLRRFLEKRRPARFANR